MAWSEGSLWVGQYRRRKIHQVDPQSGAILRSIDSNRFVTGVTWVDGELWHGTLEDRKANCGGSIRRAAKFWSNSTCRPAPPYRDSSRTAATRSFAAVLIAENCEPSGDPREAPRPKRRSKCGQTIPPPKITLAWLSPTQRTDTNKSHIAQIRRWPAGLSKGPVVYAKVHANEEHKYACNYPAAVARRGCS